LTPTPVAGDSTANSLNAQPESDSQTGFDKPYFVVKRSANVIDEATNVIQYATARVMSGGVKIGSIQPRVDNGVIPEEDENEGQMEDMEAVFESPAAGGSLGMVTGPAISTAATPFSPPQESYTALPGPVTTDPMGVPVPGHPHVASTAPSITAASVPIAQIIPGAPALAAPHAMPVVQAPAVMAPFPLMSGIPPPSIPPLSCIIAPRLPVIILVVMSRQSALARCHLSNIVRTFELQATSIGKSMSLLP